MRKHRLRIACFVLSLLYFLTSTVTPVFASISYLYDANGNMTSDGNNCYTYNDANKVSEVKNCTTQQTIAQYVYDADGNRIVKKAFQEGALAKTTYTPEKSYETIKLASDSGTQNTTYYFANGEMLARKNPDNSKTYYHNDHLSSTNILTDQTGALIEQTLYYPYGAIRSGGTMSKYLYTGKQKDAETGLNYLTARYYDANLAHFTQPDTIYPNVYDPQQLNRYSYARNNPIKYTDPSGHVIGLFLNILLGAVGIGTSRAIQTQEHAQKTNQNYIQAMFDPNLKIDNGQAINTGFAFATLGTLTIPALVNNLQAQTVVKQTVNTVVKSQNHHIIPWVGRFNFQQHPLVQEAEVNLKNLPNNIISLGNHLGGHTDEYKRNVSQTLNSFYSAYQSGKFASATEALNAAVNDLTKRISEGTLLLYKERQVWQK